MTATRAVATVDHNTKQVIHLIPDAVCLINCLVHVLFHIELHRIANLFRYFSAKNVESLDGDY